MYYFCGRFPFDTNNAIGYGLAIILQYQFVKYGFLIITWLLTMLLGVFIIVIGLTGDLKSDLKLINESAKSKSKQFQLGKQLCDFVEFHSTSKQLSNFSWQLKVISHISYECGAIYCSNSFRSIHDFAELVQPLLTMHFIVSFAVVCSTMLTIQVELVSIHNSVSFITFAISIL